MQHVVEGNAPMFRQISDLVNLAAHRAVDTEVNSYSPGKISFDENSTHCLYINHKCRKRFVKLAALYVMLFSSQKVWGRVKRFFVIIV